MNWFQLVTTAIVIIATLTGCESAQHKSSTKTMNSISTNTETDREHIVEFLYFDGCPNTPPFRQSLNQAIEQSDEFGTFTAIDLTGLPENNSRRGYGSPTILVNGHDLFGSMPPNSTKLSCRYYPAGIPNSDAIFTKLNEITP